MSYDKKYKNMGEQMPTTYTAKEKVKDVLEYPIMAIPSRGISKDTAEKFGIRTAVSPTDGVTPVAFYFSYYDQKGKLSGFKKRDMTLDKHDKYHFTAIGKVGTECKLFGQQVAEAIERPHKTIYQVEGEWDVASLYQAMVDQVKGTKYEGLEPFVVGLSCGTANAAEAVTHNAEFLHSFQELVLGNDNDHATEQERKKGIKRGLEANEDIASSLMHAGTMCVQYPNEHKDPCDMLLAGQGESLAKLFQFGKKSYTAEKIIQATDITLDDILAPRPEGVYTKVFPQLDNKLHGFRPRELTVFTSPSNVGKSLVTFEIMYHILEAGEVCGFIALEEQVKESVQRILAKRCGVNYNKFKENPLAHTTQEKISEAYNWLTQERSAFFLDHFGSLRIDELMNKVKSFVFANKVKYLLIDHLSMIFSGSTNENERKEVDLLMTQLAAFCAANDVSIIAVSHLNRSIATDFKPPKGKNGEEPQSWWVPVTKEAMRSSASLEQLSWNVIGLEPQLLASKERGHVRLTVLKNRTHGYLGICDEFVIDDVTGEVIRFEGDYGF